MIFVKDKDGKIYPIRDEIEALTACQLANPYFISAFSQNISNNLQV